MDLFSLFFFITDKKDTDGAPHVVVMPTPSKRGRKKKATTLARVGPVGGPGHETLILAHLTAGGQVRTDTTSRPKSEFCRSPVGRTSSSFLSLLIYFDRWQHCIKVETHTICPTKARAQRTAPRHTGTVCAVILIFPQPTTPPSPPAAECKRICFCASC